MAQLGIRDKNYRPNQYINPMLIGMGREPNQEDAPYRIFDKSNPEHPDYDKDDDEGDVQLELPLAKRNQSMTIAMDDKLSDYDLTDLGYYMDYNGDMYMNLDGMLFPLGQGYDRGTHGELVPKGLVQSMQINQDVANITPKDFSPPPFRYIPHIRIPEIRKQEMDHMKNFIEAMGGDTKGLVRRNLPMNIYGG